MIPPFFKDVILPAGSLLVATVSFLSKAKGIPSWAIIILVSFITIAGLVLLIPFLRWMVLRWYEFKKAKSLAKVFYPEMRDCMNNLVKELELNRTDNVIGVIRDLCGKGLANDLSQLMEKTDRIINWVFITRKLLEEPRAKDISILANATNTAVFQYNVICIHAEGDLEKLRVEVINNPDHILRKNWSAVTKRWEVAKDNQRTFIRNCEDIFRKLNIKNQERNFLLHPLLESFQPINILGGLVDQ